MHRHRQFTRWGLFVLMWIIVIVVNMPIISMILNSFRSTADILSETTLIPTQPSLVNYRYVTERTAFWQYFINSISVAGGGMILSILAATVAGYALSRFRSPVLTAYSNGRMQAFRLVVLPLAGPAIAAVAIFTFLFSYNEYLIAAIFLRNEAYYTIPVGIQQFMQQYGSDWGSLMASATLAMLPTFVLFLFVQKYMMYGAIGSGVKG